jgi:DNA (cytosine-5)-methyltransferase 1
MLNTIDLFAGCGGLTDGFKSTNCFQLLAAVEWDKHAIKALRNRLEKKYNYSNANEIAIHFDIQQIDNLINGFSDSSEFSSSLGLDKLVNKNSVDVIIGGPPCQAYSVAGRIRDGNGMTDDYRNFLFESYLAVVSKYKPKACVFENVPGMLSAKPGGTSILTRILTAFENAGYAVSQSLADDGVFDTSNFGVPQKRKRVIIFAVRNDVYKPEKAVQLFYDVIERKKNKLLRTVSDAISDLPKIFPLDNPHAKVSHYVDSKTNIKNHQPRFHNERDVDIFRILTKDIADGVNEYCNAEKLKELYTLKTGKQSSVHKYYVLRWDKPSNTIPAHLYKDGLRHIHPDPAQARTLTVREAARLQSFDDDFEFTGSAGANYKMIGNAVPPLFAKVIAEAVYEVITQLN